MEWIALVLLTVCLTVPLVMLCLRAEPTEMEPPLGQHEF